MEGSLIKSRIKLTVLCVSLLGMSTVALAPMLSCLSNTFPNAGASAVQLVMTLPGLLIALVSLAAGKMASVFSKKMLLVIGTLLIVFAAIGGYSVNSSIESLYGWSAVLGCGMGILVTITSAYISEYFEGTERASVLGLQTAFINMSGIVLTLLAGLLTVHKWNFTYLAFLIAVPPAIMCFVLLPGEPGRVRTAAKVNENSRPPLPVFAYMVAAFVFMLLYNVYASNISMFITEAGIGDAGTTGAASAVFLIGGIASGLLFGRLSKKVGNYSFVFAFFLLAICYIMSYFAGSYTILIIASFIGGASISIVVPQCVLSVSRKTTLAAMPMSVALIMAATNLGTFFSPLIFTPLSSMTGNPSARFRFLFAGFFAIALALIYGIIYYRNHFILTKPASASQRTD